MMHRFKIKHAFNLKSEGMKLKTPGQFVATEDEAQVAELREFEKQGSCEEVKSEVKKETKKPQDAKTVDQTDDITLVKGVGAGLAKKLEEKGVTTRSGLKAALKDRTEEMKEVLGMNYEKISDQLKD